MAATETIARAVFSQRLILGAMIMGIGVFTIVSLAIGPVDEGSEIANILGLVLLVLGFSETMAFTIFRTFTLGKLRRDLENDPPDEDPVSRVLLTANRVTLIGAAMAEGWGLFGTVILLLSGNTLFLLAPLLAITLILLLFPSRHKLEALAARLTGRNPYAG